MITRERGWMAAAAGVGVLVWLSWCASAGAEDAGKAAKQTTITIGQVASNPETFYKLIKPLADYLGRHLADQGIQEGRVLLGKDNQDFLGHIQRGEVDLITESLFSTLMYQELANTKILLRRWKNKSSEYRSLIFVMKGSGITTLEQLAGKKIGCEDPGSTSSYMLPKAVLKQLGLELVELKTPKDPALPGKVGVVFAGGELNISHMVHQGLVDAGALSNEELDDPAAVPDAFRPDFQVIYESPPVPRALVSVRPGLDPELEAAIVRVLLAMKDTEEGRQVLQTFQKSQFDELPGGPDAALRGMEDLYRLVRDEVL